MRKIRIIKNTMKQEKIKLYYIVLNDKFNLATPDRKRAITRLDELMDMMQNISKCNNWKIEVSYN